MTRLANAICYATRKHGGQFDKAGQPYIFHPIQVMLNMGPDATESERIVAILHDVREDCDVGAKEIYDECYLTMAELAAINRLTHLAGDYFTYIKGILPDRLACKVKLADLAHNMDFTRIVNRTDKDIARQRKYVTARKMITDHMKGY